MVPLSTEPGKVIMPSTTAYQQLPPKQIAPIIDEPHVRDLDRDTTDRTTDASCSMPPKKMDINHLLCNEEPTSGDEPTESRSSGSPGSYNNIATAAERDTNYLLGVDPHKPSLHLPSIRNSSPLATRELPSIRTLDSMPEFGSRQNQDCVAPSSQAVAADSRHKSWSQLHYEPQPTIPARTSAFQPFRHEHHPMHPHATGPTTLAAVQHEDVPLRRSSYDASQARFSAYGPSPSRVSSSLCMDRRRSVSPAPSGQGHDRYRADAYQRHHQHHASPSHYASSSSSHYASQNAYAHTYAGGYAQPGTYQQQQAGSYAHYPGVSYHDPSNPNGPPMIKAKRKRANAGQLKVLNQVFQQTFFPSTELRVHLGKQLGMSPRTVQIWFQNKRQSWRSKTRAAAAAVAREENKQQEQRSRDPVDNMAADGGDDDDKKPIEDGAESDTEITNVVGQHGHASRRSSSSSVASVLADEVKPSTPACSSPIRSPTADSSSTVSPVSPNNTQTDYFQDRLTLKSCYGQCSSVASYDYGYPHPSGSAFQHNHSRHQLLHRTSMPPSPFGYH